MELQVNAMLLSLHAASTRINIAFANHVMLLDRWWNPMAEDQAIDRAHRIGQKKVVHVHTFTMAGSIDKSVIELQERKRLIIDNIYDFQTLVPARGKSKMVDVDYIFSNMELEKDTNAANASGRSTGRGKGKAGALDQSESEESEQGDPDFEDY